jgi:hypothetical protein
MTGSINGVGHMWFCVEVGFLIQPNLGKVVWDESHLVLE